MKSYFGLLGLITLLAGCATLQDFGCSAEKQVVIAISSQLAMYLECANPTAIQQDILKLSREKIGICKQDDVVVPVSLKSWICEKASGVAIDQFAQNIPANWGCTAKMAKEKLKAYAIEACNKSTSAEVIPAKTVAPVVVPSIPTSAVKKSLKKK